MSAVENAGRWAVPTLCTYAAFTTLNRSLVRTVLNPAEGPEQFSKALPWLAALVVLYILAGWAVYTWRPWAPYLTVALFGRLVYDDVRLIGAQPRAWLEACLLMAACLWFLLPDVRLRFRYGKWLV